KAKEAVRAAVGAERGEALRALVVELKRNRIDLPEAGPVVAKLAGGDASFRELMGELLGGKRRIGGGERGAVAADCAVGEGNGWSAGEGAAAVGKVGGEGGAGGGGGGVVLCSR